MAKEKQLDQLRAEVDRIDDALHDLLMQRTQLAIRIGELKPPSLGGFLRPARHAEILRRIVARHSGAFPKASLVRIWNEVHGALVAVQGSFSLAVYMPERGAGYLELARDQYGAYAPATVYRSVGQVVRAVADGNAAVGVVPMPDREDIEPWWISLMPTNPEIPRIIARLPFLGPGPGRGDGIEALAIARIAQEATGYDRTWLGVETRADVSRARLRASLAAAGLEPTHFASTQYFEDHWLHLVEISGYVGPQDRRIGRLVEKADPVQRTVCLGGYAVPLRVEELGD